MIDNYGRNINYLRISVTDLCNLRCIYCMPECGVQKLDHKKILSVEEIEEIAKAAVRLGINKIRITGGEPLIRRGIEDIVKRISSIDGISEVCLTTNGALLPEKIDTLIKNGLTRINISLDSLENDLYKEITRGGDFEAAMQGVDAVLNAGLTPLKINAVLIGGVNNSQILPLVELTKNNDIHIRFIEIMPIGECANWNKDRFISGNTVLEMIPDLELVGTDGVARTYMRKGYKGTVGLINPISSHFCQECNRIRITADGKLKPCLHSGDEILIKGLHGDELYETMKSGIMMKPISHHLSAGEKSESTRGMSAIGG